MPFATVEGGALYYEDMGEGTPILAIHGFSETAEYWLAGGVGQALAERFRFVPMDMRGHGRSTIVDGFDVVAVAADIDRLADHLNLSRFHLLGHATGSVAALRYAMQRPPRLASLAVTSAASATAMIPPGDEGAGDFFANMARFYAMRAWDEILPRIRLKPWPFLHQLDRHPEREALWSRIETVFTANDPRRLSRFVEQFYTDPDPRVKGLRSIACPVLVVSAEHDDLMREPEALVVRETPGARFADFAGVGHMTALEAPDRLSEMLLDFFAAVEPDRQPTPPQKAQA
ncbi:alpha/beta fold hydrolase [Novosphingobium sp. Gsoil 351]|uniref:alpha/beta fold hydrolase n=1 Tax=Novosphingobium sp. Gsoil 351 TaxID=2675225 RepID=UPI0012B4A569|nr:alpha/beta hydrolase [Novosphingobium sp. Gsoil 351]QGN55502.1 alpha/beta fold hydrolase [Novosphingobium sp. Gsoil 351]